MAEASTSLRELSRKQPRFLFWLLVLLGTAIVATSLLTTHRRGMLMLDQPSAFAADDRGYVPEVYMVGFGNGLLQPASYVTFDRQPVGARRLIGPRGGSSPAIGGDRFGAPVGSGTGSQVVAPGSGTNALAAAPSRPGSAVPGTTRPGAGGAGPGLTLPPVGGGGGFGPSPIGPVGAVPPNPVTPGPVTPGPGTPEPGTPGTPGTGTPGTGTPGTGTPGTGNPGTGNPGTGDPGTGGGGSDGGGPVTPAIPEPESWLLMIMGLFGLGFMMRRQNGRVTREAAIA